MLYGGVWKPPINQLSIRLKFHFTLKQYVIKNIRTVVGCAAGSQTQMKHLCLIQRSDFSQILKEHDLIYG